MTRSNANTVAYLCRLKQQKLIFNALGQSNKYSQHRQNYLNNYFRAEVGKNLPKQFPDPFPVGKQGVGNLALSHTAKTPEAEITKSNSREASCR